MDQRKPETQLEKIKHIHKISAAISGCAFVLVKEVFSGIIKERSL